MARLRMRVLASIAAVLVVVVMVMIKGYVIDVAIRCSYYYAYEFFRDAGPPIVAEVPPAVGRELPMAQIAYEHLKHIQEDRYGAPLKHGCDVMRAMRPAAICLDIDRYGGQGDGGKWACGLRSGWDDRKRVIYSVGSNLMVSRFQ